MTGLVTARGAADEDGIAADFDVGCHQSMIAVTLHDTPSRQGRCFCVYNYTFGCAYFIMVSRGVLFPSPINLMGGKMTVVYNAIFALVNLVSGFGHFIVPVLAGAYALVMLFIIYKEKTNINVIFDLSYKGLIKLIPRVTVIVGVAVFCLNMAGSLSVNITKDFGSPSDIHKDSYLFMFYVVVTYILFSVCIFFIRMSDVKEEPVKEDSVTGGGTDMFLAMLKLATIILPWLANHSSAQKLEGADKEFMLEATKVLKKLNGENVHRGSQKADGAQVSAN